MSAFNLCHQRFRLLKAIKHGALDRRVRHVLDLDPVPAMHVIVCGSNDEGTIP
jgi:hypothetical protein